MGTRPWSLVLGFIALGLVDVLSVGGIRLVADGPITGPARWALIGFVVSVGVLAGFLAARRPLQSGRAIYPYLALCVLVTITAARLMDESTLGVVAPSYLGRAPGVETTRQAQHDLMVGGGCVMVASKGVLPPPYQRCATGDRVTYSKGGDPSPLGNSNPNSPSWRGLVYAPGLTDATKVVTPDICVRHLGGAWWAFMGSDNAQGPCASSFMFVPAP